MRKVYFSILNFGTAYFTIVFAIFMNKSWHWELGFTSLINYNLWLIIFLFAFAIYRAAQYNRYIFLNISLLALMYALSFFHTLIGDKYLFGNDFLIYYILPYRKFLISLFTCISIVYITIDYLFYNEKVVTKYLWTLGIVVPFCFYFYYQFLVDPKYVFTNYDALIFRNLETNMLALFFIVLYGIFVYLKEKPISRYVDAIVVLFFFFIMYDGFDSGIIYFKINNPLPISSQLLLTVILVFFILLFHTILKNIYSDFGQFYDRFIFKETNVDLKIIKKQSRFSKLFIMFRDYLRIFPNRFSFFLISTVGLAMFIMFVPIGYGKRIILFLLLALILFLIYYYILSKKK